MEINADFTDRVLVHSDDLPWVASPMAGVDRRMLDRIGDEVARATSIVRYAPGSHFSEHTHTGGEEFIVLSGVFHDEHGDFPAGTYVRNPPTSRHTPGSEDGCIIFVKLWQFDLSDRTQLSVDMAAQLERDVGSTDTILHQDARETVSYSCRHAGERIDVGASGGIEVLVLGGRMTWEDEELRVGSWLRLPDGDALQARAGAEGVTFWMKTGHLPFAKAPAA